MIDKINEVIKTLSIHAYDKEQFDACKKDLSLIDDSFAFDHAYCIEILNEVIAEIEKRK